MTIPLKEVPECFTTPEIRSAKSVFSGAFSRFVFPIDARLLINRGQRRVREAPLALLRSRPLQFGRGSGGTHNSTEIRSPECLSLRETGKVGNVLTISPSRCTACAHLSHVGLLSAALKVIGSRGKT
jgi:hypothetical protein